MSSEAIVAARAFDGNALLDHLHMLSKIAPSISGGYTRTAFSPAFVAGRTMVTEILQGQGFITTIDVVGNFTCCLKGTNPTKGAIVIGSHLDTVIGGGLLDGAYGVLAGLGTLLAISKSGITLEHSVILCGFINEEGANGTTAMLGSRAAAGRLGDSDLSEIDQNGTSLKTLIAGVGGDLNSFREADLTSKYSLEAYLELHIEQGPILERDAIEVGVVNAITGRALFNVEFVGTASHAGTTPMQGRSDALIAAARYVLEVCEIACNGSVRVATCGDLEVVDGARNTIPGLVRITAELRDDSAQRIRAALEHLELFSKTLSIDTEVGVVMNVIDIVAPSPTDPRLREIIRTASTLLGKSVCEMSSGAGHDAQSFAGVVPIGLIFVPSIDGISHSGKEDSLDRDLISGGEVLTAAVVLLDRALTHSNRSGLTGMTETTESR